MQILSFFSTDLQATFSWRSVQKNYKFSHQKIKRWTVFIGNKLFQFRSRTQFLIHFFKNFYLLFFFLFCRSSNSFQNRFKFIRFEAVSFLGNWGFMVFLRGFISGWGKDSKLDDSWLICLLNWRLFWRYILMLIRRSTAQNWYEIMQYVALITYVSHYVYFVMIIWNNRLRISENLIVLNFFIIKMARYVLSV